jgi:hypothetical protein
MLTSATIIIIVVHKDVVPVCTNDYQIGVWCFSAKHATLRRKSKDWLARNQNNVLVKNKAGITRIPRYNLTLKKLCLHEYIFQFYWNKYKITNEKHYTIRPVLKSNKNKNHKTISNIDTSNTHVHDSSFFWLGTGMSVDSF